MKTTLAANTQLGWRPLLLKGLAATFAFALLWAWFLLGGYRDTDNLAYVFVRSPGGSLGADALKVTGASPWDSKTELSLHPSRGWGPPGGEKRFLGSLQVSPSTERLASESVNLQAIASLPWEISVATGLPQVWRPALVQIDAESVSLALPTTALPGYGYALYKRNPPLNP